jgi:hypothetical protein
MSPFTRMGSSKYSRPRSGSRLNMSTTLHCEATQVSPVSVT